MKLDEGDLRVLAMLGTGTRTIGTLSADLDRSPDELGARLADLAENGLVYDLGDGRYERTESGRRVLVASPAGSLDERIDTSPEVERVLAGLSLGPDEADAVRGAFALLRYWGRVTAEEIADAIYSEVPAGYVTSAEWWNDLVREPLGALPGVQPPTGDDEAWHYAGHPEADEPFTDGRRVLSKLHPVYGDVKHALESLDLREEDREAARAAFGFLYRRGEVTERELVEAVYRDRPAGVSSADEWLDEVVRRTFDALPGVERSDGSAWRYRRP